MAKRRVERKKPDTPAKLLRLLKQYALLIGAVGAIGSLYFTFLSYCMNVYNSDRRGVDSERASFEKLVAGSNLEAALRRYREVSLMPLRKKPSPLFPMITFIPFLHDHPNREPLWILIKTALHHHANNYVVYSVRHRYIGINLAYADLRGTKLCGCDFTLVDMYKTNLRDADLRGADFSNAFLLETDLRNCNMGEVGGKFSQFTKLFISDSNAFLFDKAGSQFEQRTPEDLEKGVRYRVGDKQVRKWVEQLNDTCWVVRYLAVCGLGELRDDHKTSAVRSALLGLLRKEVTTEIDGVERVTIRLPSVDEKDHILIAKTRVKYFEYLLQKVTALEDTSSVHILVRFTGEGRDYLIGAMVEIGSPAIDPLMKILYSGMPTLRMGAAWTFGNMLGKKDALDRNARSKVLNSLFNGLEYNAHPTDAIKEWNEILSEYAEYMPDDTPVKDESWFDNRIKQKYLIRRRILRAFSMSNEPKVLPWLEKVAESDPYTEITRDGRIVYPVREQAKGVINAMARP